jgi:biopolymer transport protein ExbD
MASVDSGQELRSGGRRKMAQDFELNLAPIIDCMVVLIAFLMASMSYLSIQIIDAGVAAGKGVAGKTESTVLEIRAAADGQLKIQARTARGPVGQAWALSVADLSVKMPEINAKTPGIKAATLMADDRVNYEQVVKILDQVKETIPSVQLSGF